MRTPSGNGSCPSGYTKTSFDITPDDGVDRQVFASRLARVSFVTGALPSATFLPISGHVDIDDETAVDPISSAGDSTAVAPQRAQVVPVPLTLDAIRMRFDTSASIPADTGAQVTVTLFSIAEGATAQLSTGLTCSNVLTQAQVNADFLLTCSATTAIAPIQPGSMLVVRVEFARPAGESGNASFGGTIAVSLA